jgi:protoporphyrinogen oxidase
MVTATARSVAIIGAGPAGLTAAYQLARKGLKVTVFEASNGVGGMAKTLTMWGQQVDLGPHRFFSSDPRVNAFWRDVVGSDYSIVTRRTRIRYGETFVDYPLRPFNTLKALGFAEATWCTLSYIRAQVLPGKHEDSFEAWVCKHFGTRLFSVFFKSYSEKLWGISCQDLDSEFATHRIGKLSLYEAIRSALFGMRGGRHRTLVADFAYPNRGSGVVYERLAERIRQCGGDILLGTAVQSLGAGADADARPCVTTRNGQRWSFDHVVSCMPITLLVDSMDAPASIRQHAHALRFRNTILVYLQIGAESPFSDQWIYVHSPDLQTGRITNFRNWVPALNNDRPETILCLEYWCNADDELWHRQDGALVDLATREMYMTGLIAPASVKDGKVVRVPRCYPVYARGYREHLAPIEQFLSAQHNISVIGRYGAFKYNNQDHSILMGLLAAENIAEGAHHNLWAVNAVDERDEAYAAARTTCPSL